MNLERPEMPAEQQAAFYPLSLAMWHVLQNDRQQRQLAMAALANLPTTLKIEEGIKRLQWALKQTDKLADYRNLVVHAPIKLNWKFKESGDFQLGLPVAMMGGPSTRRSHFRRLRSIKDLRFWTSLRNDLLNLGEYVDFVGRRIAWLEYERRNGAPVVGALRSWPHRPRLRSIRRIETIERSLEHQNPVPTKRRKRRRPSGGRPPGRS
jgi:hypothetical protein